MNLFSTIDFKYLDVRPRGKTWNLIPLQNYSIIHLLFSKINFRLEPNKKKKINTNISSCTTIVNITVNAPVHSIN